MNKKIKTKIIEKIEKEIHEIKEELLLLEEKRHNLLVQSNTALEDQEKAQYAVQKEEVERLYQNKSQRLRMANMAKIRSGNLNFGLCEDCDEEISEKRLNVNPLSLRCISCQRIFEEEN